MKNIKNILSLILVIVFAVFVSNYEDNTEAVSNTNLPYVSVSGESFGIKLHTAGVLVISLAEVETEQGSKSPAEDLGLKSGDIITKIDGNAVKTCAEVSDYVEKCGGKSLIITFTRAGEEKSVALKPEWSTVTQSYKAGLWIRDSSAGIGTVSFVTKDGHYGALGHGVTDVDTQTLMPLDNGEAMCSDIIGYSKAEKGKAGELYGVLASQTRGSIALNTQIGVFGKTQVQENAKWIPTASLKQIRRGKATLLTTIDETGVQEYEVYITYISRFGVSSKDMIVKVTDKKLLEKTGGILQGMSGSPIVQDGRFVGALTHVFVNKPELGYAVFGYKMVNMALNSDLLSTAR